MEQAERHRRREFSFCRFCCRFYEGGRCSFGDEHPVSRRAQPLGQQRQLRRLPGSVDAPDDEQRPALRVVVSGCSAYAAADSDAEPSVSRLEGRRGAPPTERSAPSRRGPQLQVVVAAVAARAC